MNFKDRLNKLSQNKIDTENTMDNSPTFQRTKLNDQRYQQDAVNNFVFDLTNPNAIDNFEGFNKNFKREQNMLDLTVSDNKVDTSQDYNEQENDDDWELLLEQTSSISQNELQQILGVKTEIPLSSNLGSGEVVIKSTKLDNYKKKTRQELINDYINENINFWYRMNALYITPENPDPTIDYERITSIAEPDKVDFSILKKKNYRYYNAIEEGLDLLKKDYEDLISEIKNSNVFKGSYDQNNSRLEDIDIPKLKGVLLEKYRNKLHNFLRHLNPYAKIINKAGGIEQEAKDISAFKTEFETDVVYDVLGISAIFPFLKNTQISEVMTIGPYKAYIELHGRLVKTKVAYVNEEPLKRYAKEIAAKLDRPLDGINLSVDARLPDGSRFHGILPPVSRHGTTLTIRKFSEDKLKLEDLIDRGSLTVDMSHFIRSAVASRLNIVVAGGTGSGKTTMLNICSNYIGAYERTITVEDSAELQLIQDHVVSLETKESKDKDHKTRSYAIRDLVKECLRMRPDRILCGECRGGEAWDMLVAMNTGHEGSMTTIHANNPIDTIKRIANMVAQVAGDGVPMRVIYEQIASSVELVVYQARLFDGSRKTTYISEVRGYNIVTQAVEVIDLYKFIITGEDSEGHIEGYFEWTGNLPSPEIVYKVHSKGYTFPQEIEDGLKNRKELSKGHFTLAEEKEMVEGLEFDNTFKQRLKDALEVLHKQQSENEFEIIEQLEIPRPMKKKLLRLMEQENSN